jgi:hypothetical protein
MMKISALLLLADRPEQQVHQPRQNEHSMSTGVHGLPFWEMNKVSA